MIATVIISIVVFSYAAIMIVKSFNSVKKSLRGEGCSNCSGDCNKCVMVSNIKFK